MRHEFHKLTLSRVRKWHKDYYTPDNMTLVITGDIEFGAVDEIASKYFGEQKEPHVIQTPRYEVYPDSNHVRISDQQSSQGIILIGGFAPGLDDQNEVLPMTILCQILGGDTNSQLFNELREKYGLAYSVEMEYFTWKKMGTFITEACVDRKNTERGVQMIKQIFKDIAEKGVSERELTKIKNHIAGQMLQQEESVASVASAIGYRLALGLGIEHYLTRRERLRVVSREQVQAVAQKYLREENYYIQILK